MSKTDNIARKLTCPVRKLTGAARKLFGPVRKLADAARKLTGIARKLSGITRKLTGAALYMMDVARRLSMLVVLVMLIFSILFVSVGASGFAMYALFRMGIISPLTMGSMPAFILLLLLVSLFIGTIIAIIGGERFLRPIRSLIEATREIGAGNFDVRVDTGGRYEIERLAKSFNEMAKELSSIETLRSDFVSNISHEFKTPIASIRGFARRLKKESLTEGQRNEYLDIIISESDRLSRLSSNVLLLSRLESSDRIFEKAEYSLDEQIRRAILTLEPQLSGKQLEVEADIGSVCIYASEEILSHLWLNLLTNAIKFSPAGGTIHVSLAASGGSAVATVSDMGVGMDEDVKRHIFDKFYQGDPSRAADGNGLGLSLVKRILELENGSISVDSEPGKGARFTVTLPIK
ncbi:MAG: HAMP domain-containing histidine kinase [Oscillospiraceae bacterium]|nr:HAMP domain-containing histidine kinase [Oscillospiraceae bacterium]